MSVEQQFSCLFDEHSGHVRRYAMSLVVGDEVDEMVQRTFLTAWQRYDDIPEGSEREWLFGVTRNHCRNAWRTGRRSKALVAAIEHARPQLLVEVTDQGFDASEVAPLLQALGELSEVDCELMVLTGFHELTPAEIARVLGDEAGTVRVRLTRARTKLRARFAELTRDSESA
jgi:RNA polymerase sigma factor (sigma-70 family)